MHGEYKQRKAAGEFEAFKPLNTRELLQQILHKLNAACSPQPALDYTCMPMRQQLTTMEELEAVQQQNLDLLVAAAADAADEGAGDLLGECMIPRGESLHVYPCSCWRIGRCNR